MVASVSILNKQNKKKLIGDLEAAEKNFIDLRNGERRRDAERFSELIFLS